MSAMERLARGHIVTKPRETLTVPRVPRIGAVLLRQFGTAFGRTMTPCGGAKPASDI